MRRAFAFLLLVALTLPAQDDFKISTTSQLVIEIVEVKDKNGNTIEGLTAKDFTVTEDGKPQSIKVCEFQRLKEDAAPAYVPASLKDNAPVTQIAPEKSGDIRYRDRRLLALYFDMSSMLVIDQLRALASAQNFIRNRISGPDLIALMSFSGGAVRVLQDFTDDRGKLDAVLHKIVIGEGLGNDADPSDDSSSDTGTAFGQNDGEFSIFNTDRQLAALQTAVQMLDMLNEKKALVYFASGMRLNGVDNQAQLQATVNAAIRANVSFFPVDARGLVAEAPLGDATKESPGGIGMYSGASALAVNTAFQRSQDTMYALGADTGGKALLDNNDLGRGIQQAQQSISSYYILGYYSTNTALDGKYRRVKVTVNGVEANLQFRQGYYAGKEFAKFTSTDKERQLEDALMMGDPITNLTIALELNYFQLNRAEYFVPLTVKIPGSELARARRRGAEHTVIDFIGEIKDDNGATVSNVRDKIDIKLTGNTAAELSKRPVIYDTGFTLLPGKYALKFLARDDETGRMGTFITRFVIPNLNNEEKRIPTSSVVLSSQKLDMKDSLYTAKEKSITMNLLMQGGQKLLPSVTRVFSRKRDLYVYLEAYERDASMTQPIVSYVSFLRGEKKEFESAPVAVTDGLDPKSKALPLRFDVPLDRLQPGRYVCQVTLLDPTNGKATFWSAPISVVE